MLAPATVAQRILPINRDKVVGWLEVGSVFATLEGALWSEGPARQVWSWLTLALILVFLTFERRSPRQLGVKFSPRRAWWIPFAAAAAAGVILLIGRASGTLHGLYGPQVYYKHALGYGLWTIVQEFIAQGFFFTHFEQLLHSGRRAVLANAILFSVCHWPSIVLVPVTFFGGLILTELFRRYRTIFPLAIAHFLVALSIAVSVPDNLHRHMRVGIGYIHYGDRTNGHLPLHSIASIISQHVRWN